MAKNFSQIEGNDNPVNQYLKAAKQEEKAYSDASAILSSIGGNSSVVAKVEPVQTAAVISEPEPKADPVETKKILMNINIRESTKKQWKMFFLEHDLTMTQGIETAVEYLMSEVNKGNIRLSKGGITK